MCLVYLLPRCSRRWRVPTASRFRLCKRRSRRCHAPQKWFPKTVMKASREGKKIYYRLWLVPRGNHEGYCVWRGCEARFINLVMTRTDIYGSLSLHENIKRILFHHITHEASLKFPWRSRNLSAFWLFLALFTARPPRWIRIMSSGMEKLFARIAMGELEKQCSMVQENSTTEMLQ